MKKHCTFGKKSLVIVMEMLSILGIIGIVSFMFTRCIVVTNNKNFSFLINPFEDDEYEDSDSLAEMFANDSADLIYYLALCQQFETDGEFDKEKTIDLLEYYYRKQPGSMKASSDGQFVYKVQDLINWGNTYGVDIQDGIVEEKYYPVDGKSIYEKDIMTILESSLPNGISGFQRLDKTSVSTEAVAKAVNTAEEENQAETENISVDMAVENGEIKADEFSSMAEAMDYLMLFSERAVDAVSLEECQKGVQAIEYLESIGYSDEKLIEQTDSKIQEIPGGEEEKKNFCMRLYMKLRCGYSKTVMTMKHRHIIFLQKYCLLLFPT